MEKPIRKLATLLLCAAAAFTLHAQDPRETGPTTLVITYRCPPEKRPDLRNYMRQDGLQRLEGYRRNAILAGYPAVEKAEVTMKPFWKSAFPANKNEITVTVAKPDLSP